MEARRLRLRACAAFGFRNIDAALEIRAVFDHDAAGLDITDQLRFLLDIDLVGRLDIALNRALDDDLTRLESRLHSGVGADGQAMLVALDGAFHFAIDGQIFSAKI